MRAVCHRCRRPATVCYCRDLRPLSTRTRLVFLQHPRERRVAIGTARMAHLGLMNSELHLGVDFTGHPRLEQLLREPASRVAVLYPGEGAAEPASWRDEPPTALLVIDGTWTQARKVLERNPVLQALPRVGLRPRRPGNYRIRKEPAAHCLSTIEAVVEVLGELEGEPERFQPMLRAFERMVDQQLACQASRVGPPRTKRRPLRAPRRAWTPLELQEQWERVVLIHGEANAPAFASSERFDPELVQLVAVRPSTGERFEAIIAPRRPLAERTPDHLELPEGALREGEPISRALARWRAFARAEDVLGTWGGFTLELLQSEGDMERAFLNLRLLAARKLNQRLGGMQSAAARMGGPPLAVWAQGRAGRRIAALERVLEGLLRPDGPRLADNVGCDGRG